MTEDPAAQHGMRPEHYARLSALYGSGEEGVEQLFPEGRPIGAPPHPKWEVRSKQGVRYNASDVQTAIRRTPPELSDVDPRTLHSTQRGLTRPGVEHYMTDPSYDATGATYADSEKIGNRYPVIYSRQESSGATRNIILSGHHRATKALLRGENLRAIVVPGQEGDVTPPAGRR